ncbi:MAG: TetR/AcrR family transcriptional regulator [Deltaproteobacteria bacterium]|nr:TetR/AcrR family transcriptional regulator [Deltaproteobacteria bacterium]
MSHQKRESRRDAGRARGAPIVEAVLSRTLEELAESGLEGLSVERIARRAEVNKTSVYRRWPTRGELVAAALEQVLDGLAAQVPDTGSLRGDLLGMLEGVATLASGPTGRAVVRAALSPSSQQSVASLAARRLKAHAEAPGRALVARARRRGEWRAGASRELLLSVLVGGVLHRALLENQPVTRRWLASLVDQVLRGVMPSATRSR